MRKQASKISGWAVATPILLAALIWGLEGGDKVYAETLTILAEVSPLYDDTYKASLESTKLEGRVGIPVSIWVDLSPYPPPAGYFYSSVVDVLESPQGAKPKIVSGDREIQVRCPIPGNYRLLVRVNLISKSSCGGAEAEMIDEQEVLLVIVK